MPPSCLRSCLFEVNEVNPDVPMHYPRPEYFPTGIYTIICLKSVDVRKLQVAILARSPREMSQTDRILPWYILSRGRV